MTNNDLKREHGLSDESNQTQADAKAIHLEYVHESELFSVDENCHDVKGFGFVQTCRDLASQRKAKQTALKPTKTIHDCSSPGKIFYFFIIVKFSSY